MATVFFGETLINSRHSVQLTPKSQSYTAHVSLSVYSQLMSKLKQKAKGAVPYTSFSTVHSIQDNLKGQIEKEMQSPLFFLLQATEN
jgi:hypothetical protein